MDVRVTLRLSPPSRFQCWCPGSIRACRCDAAHCRSLPCFGRARADTCADTRADPLRVQDFAGSSGISRVGSLSLLPIGRSFILG
jgi:hypothetical protein